MITTSLLAIAFLALLGADERDDLLSKAGASVREAALRVKDDPDRPRFHVLPPAFWMNDPNGPIYFRGYYHLFYQHNPYGDAWGHMHWGHARSKDLAHWEHQPIALWPSRSQGEEHVFSGSAAIGPDARPILFYTSIGKRAPEQWAALAEDDTLVRWKKHPANPILTEALHGDTRVHEWRDPFVFRHGGRAWMVCGGNTNANKGGEASVFLYRAEDDTLTRWSYRGVLFRHPDPKVKNIECPLFFPIDGRWVLIVSQGRPVDGFVGDFDEASATFRPTARAPVDAGQFYAPSVLLNDPKGRRILWGWIDGVPEKKGWRHCLTLPRVLSIGDDGTLRQTPAPELAALRGPRVNLEAIPLDNNGEPQPIALPDSDALEIALSFDPAAARSVGLLLGDTKVALEGRTLRVGDRRVEVLGDTPPTSLRLFLDRSILEVHADNRASLSLVVPRTTGRQVSAFAEGGEGRATIRSLQAWPMETIWNTAP